MTSPAGYVYLLTWEGKQPPDATKITWHGRFAHGF